jgi:hypothetical protein
MRESKRRIEVGGDQGRGITAKMVTPRVFKLLLVLWACIILAGWWMR